MISQAKSSVQGSWVVVVPKNRRLEDSCTNDFAQRNHLLPVADIVSGAGGSVGARRPEVVGVGVFLARKAVLVRVAPGIVGEIFEIGTFPFAGILAGRCLEESVKTLAGRGVIPDVKVILFEGCFGDLSDEELGDRLLPATKNPVDIDDQDGSKHGEEGNREEDLNQGEAASGLVLAMERGSGWFHEFKKKDSAETENKKGPPPKGDDPVFGVGSC